MLSTVSDSHVGWLELLCGILLVRVHAHAVKLKATEGRVTATLR